MQKSYSKQKFHEEELQWWIKKLEIYNVCYLIQPHIQVLKQTDLSRKEWVEYVKGYQQEGWRWLNEEQLLHIKLLELKAVKLALLAFNKQKTLTAVHFQIDNTNALLYLVKNGRNREPNVAEIKRRNLAVSLETPDRNYWRTPSNFLNVEADWQSRNSREASEWKL